MFLPGVQTMPFERQPSVWKFSRPESANAEPDSVNHPGHYNSHPSGVEVIRITEHMNFCLGNAIKYILRCDHKGNAIEDLKKARWYIDREIKRRGGE
jgi:hypothetical protein